MRLPQDVASFPLPGFNYTGTRVNLTAGSSTSRAAIPTGSAGKFVVVRVSAPVFLKFGDNAVDAATNASSVLWTGSELIHYIPAGTTHVAVIRVGSADCTVQLELLSDGQLI